MLRQLVLGVPVGCMQSAAQLISIRNCFYALEGPIDHEGSLVPQKQSLSKKKDHDYVLYSKELKYPGLPGSSEAGMLAKTFFVVLRGEKRSGCLFN